MRRALRVFLDTVGTALSLSHHLRPVDRRPIRARAEEWLDEAERNARKEDRS